MQVNIGMYVCSVKSSFNSVIILVIWICPFNRLINFIHYNNSLIPLQIKHTYTLYISLELFIPKKLNKLPLTKLIDTGRFIQLDVSSFLSKNNAILLKEK